VTACSCDRDSMLSWCDFLAGCIGGCAGVMVGHPLDTLKVSVLPIPHWPLPAVRDLTRDGRWSTYDVSVLKLSNNSFRGKCAQTGHPLKIPSPTKLFRLVHFPQASQGFYVYVFSLVLPIFSLICTAGCGLAASLIDRYFFNRKSIALSSPVFMYL
jgi:hypothetical protein